MAELVKADMGLNLGDAARSSHGRVLVALAPDAAVSLREHDGAAGATGAYLLKEWYATVWGQDDVARLASLALTYGESAAVRVEVGDLKTSQFRIPSAGFKSRPDQQSEVWIARID